MHITQYQLSYPYQHEGSPVFKLILGNLIIRYSFLVAVVQISHLLPVWGIKEADEQNNLQQVYNYILTGKSDVKIADVLAKMSEEEIKKLFPDNFKDEFLNGL